MAITFNDVWANLLSCSFYDSSAGTYTQRGSTRQVKNCDMFPDSGVDAGDAFVMAIEYATYGATNGYGKCNKVKINIDTAVAAGTWEGVWEYAHDGSNAVPLWSELTVVSDGTSNLQATGSQTLEFEVPDDWDNFHLTNISGGSWIYYSWLIRFRVTSVASLTEGGHIIDSNDNAQSCGYTIHVDGYDSGSPCTMDDIYDADVAGSWGVVTKNKNQFYFNCNLAASAGNYISSKSEQIIFNTNWIMANDGALVSGEVYSGNKVRYGSSIIFLGANCNYPGGGVASAGSRIYNSHIRHYWEKTAVGYNGYWSGGLGGTDQIIYDTYIERMRNMSFSGATNGIIGVKHTAHIEGSGAIIAEGTVFSSGYGVRTQNGNPHYIHSYDFSKVATAPFNPYLSNNDNNNFYAVDCDYGAFTYDKYAYWVSGSGTNNKIWIILSFLLKVVDEAGNAISGATATLTDKNGDEVFSYETNTDGYAGEDSGSMTAATASSISDTLKSWTQNLWRFKEVYITSGSGVGQRRYICYHSSTYTTLPLVPDFQTTPSATDRYIIIPYVSWLELAPITEETTSSVWSTYTNYNPFTLTITKSGYKKYESTFTLNKKFDQVITLSKAKDLNFSNKVKRITQ